MAKCSKCNREATVQSQPDLPVGVYEMDTLSYAEAEKLAWYCDRCDKLYCGLCCLPKWSKMRAETGLSAEALARQIKTSEDYFIDVPKCPDCGKMVSDKVPSKIGPGCLGVISLLVLTGMVVWWMF